MVSVAEHIEEEIHFFKQYIESLEMLINEAISKEIASIDIHVKMDEERIKELIKILEEKIGEIDRQYKKFYNREVKEELDYWRERAIYESAFLYVLQEKYEEAIALIREELERGRPLYEEPFSNLRLAEIFFRRSEKFLEDYEHSILWERERLVRDMSPSTRDRNMEWSLRAAFASWECLYSLWKSNKRIFMENGGMTKEVARKNSKLIRELTTKIKNIVEGKIV